MEQQIQEAKEQIANNPGRAEDKVWGRINILFKIFLMNSSCTILFFEKKRLIRQIFKILKGCQNNF